LRHTRNSSVYEISDNDVPFVQSKLIAKRSLLFKDKEVKVIFPMLVGDFLKIMLGLALSVAVVSGVIYFDSF